MEIIASAFVLATFVEGLITYVFGGSNDAGPRSWIKYVSLGFGVLVSVLYRVDILAAAGLVAIHPFVGYVVSGLVIGRGSNYLNDFVSVFKK